MRPHSLRSVASVLVLPFVVALAAQACTNDETIMPATTSSSSSSSGTGGSAGTGGMGGAGGGPKLDKPCDPVVPSACGFPFPSDVYLVDDASTKSGHRVNFPKAALPTIVGSGHIDPAPWNSMD